MVAAKDDKPTFALERFDWGAPDRLELAGTFHGLPPLPAEAPVLVLSGDEGTYRLPAAAGDVAPEDGQPWHAAFTWQEAPVAFAAAALELGPEVAVELPAPGAGAQNGAGLEVRVAPGAEPALEPETMQGAPEPDLEVAAAFEGSERLRLETELLGAREELRDAGAAARRAAEDVERARADLAAEREERAADALRFREGLAQVRASAEAALAELRGERDAARAETALLAERVEALSAAGADVERLGGQLTAAQTEADDVSRRLETAAEALEQARAATERLLGGVAAEGVAPGAEG